VNGRAPAPVTFALNAGPIASAAHARFTFNPVTSELAYSVKLSGAKADDVAAVVIRRFDAALSGAAAHSRVIKRVLGPQMTAAAGTLRLLGDDLDAFKAGRLTLALFGSAGADPIAEVKFAVPK
jgi:hypothetical protein